MCPHAQIEREEFDGKKIRCLVAHDHVLLRQGLRRLLEDEADMEVVGEAGSAAEALQLAFEYCPDVVITDARFFGCAGDSAERLILQESAQSKVLFLAAQDGDDAESTSCAARQTSAEELVGMVRNAYSGETLRREDSAGGDVLPRKHVLTTREREVLKLLAEGKTVRSAADLLGLSLKTVDAHKFNLMRKLGIHNKAELVMWAIQKRVVKVPAN